MFARFVARRYLFSPKSRSVVNLIASLSVVAVAMPVAAMIILLSVFNGFETLVRSTYSTFDAPLTITPVRGQTFPIAQLDTASMASVDGVTGLSYQLEQIALVEHEGRQATVSVRGVDDAYEAVMPAIPGLITSGEYRVRLGDYDRIVMGQTMAYMLGLHSLAYGDVSLYALRRGEFSSLLPMESYTRREAKTAGIFTLDLDSERNHLLTSLRMAQELFLHPDRASALLVGLGAGVDEQQMKARLQSVVGSDFVVRTRYELRSSLYAIMNYEKWGIFFISLLVLVISSFSIVGSLGMLITDKRADIVTLRAMGASTDLVQTIFRWEGWFVAGCGAALGGVVGVGLTLLQQYFGFIEIPADTFLTKSYPVEFRWIDLAAVLASFVVVTTLLTHLTVGSMIKNEKR